ncbi:MAG TPA: lipocalin family protein [Prolixibacteraceae bacterium]|nr:lipocalin family protein [Prolixibacteraceae bacterium]
MKSFKYLFLLVIALTIAVASCKKDEVTKSKKELLTAKQWKFLSRKTNGVADVINNCEKDDFTIFSSNGTYTWNPTTVKCDPSQTIQTGTWTLSSDEKTLSVDGDEATIVELTESRLVVSTIDGSDVWEQTFVAF